MFLPLGLSPQWLQALPAGRSPFHPHTPRPSSLMHQRKEGQLGTILAPVGTRGEEPLGGLRGTFPGWPLEEAQLSGTRPLLEGTPGGVLVFVGWGCQEGPPATGSLAGRPPCWTSTLCVPRPAAGVSRQATARPWQGWGCPPRRSARGPEPCPLPGQPSWGSRCGGVRGLGLGGEQRGRGTQFT